MAADGGMPNDAAKPGVAGVRTAENGTVTRADRDGNGYEYSRSGYLERFANYSVGGIFQGLAGFGIGELGIISMLRTNVPVRIAIGTNHIVVASTAIPASSSTSSAAGCPRRPHDEPGVDAVEHGHLDLSGHRDRRPNRPYVSAALDTGTIKKGVGALFAIIATALFLMAFGGFGAARVAIRSADSL